MTKTALLLGAALSVAAVASAADFKIHTFKKIQITDQFWCEGAFYGDFNKDGKMDLCGGPFWWEGPDFKTRHEFRPADKTSKVKQPDGSEVTIPGYKGGLTKENDYSDSFLTYTDDFDRDGWTDIMVYGFPGKEAFWYRNPQNKKNAEGKEHWQRVKAIDVLDNESPMFADVNGDGKNDILCNSSGFLTFATANSADPLAPWALYNISPKGNWQRFSHGIGIGDVNGDGRMDFLEANGWWEQPASLKDNPVWANHPFPFAPKTGSAQMYAYDFNGDGLNDILTTLAPHNYGLAWYRQTRTDGQISFQQNLIVNRTPAESPYGVKFSQIHAIDLVDMDGDGIKDIVTGKRFWAHGPTGDDEPGAPAVLYWFQTRRGANGTVDFVPHLVDDNSGVGTQVAAADINGDRLPDIIVGNKKGIFVFLHEAKSVSQPEYDQAQPKRVAGQ
jgi:hypothetical protein